MTSKFKKTSPGEPPTRPLTGDPVKDGYAIKYDGRTITLTVHINTDRPIHEVAEAVRRAARGPASDMVSVVGGESSDTRELWQQLYQIATKASKAPS